MRRITLWSASLVIGAALPLLAQKDAPQSKTLKLPPARTAGAAPDDWHGDDTRRDHHDPGASGAARLLRGRLRAASVGPERARGS